jgi:hypothetical protein
MRDKTFHIFQKNFLTLVLMRLGDIGSITSILIYIYILIHKS